jgi:hypothetical protein
MAEPLPRSALCIGRVVAVVVVIELADGFGTAGLIVLFGGPRVDV